MNEPNERDRKLVKDLGIDPFLPWFDEAVNTVAAYREEIEARPAPFAERGQRVGGEARALCDTHLRYLQQRIEYRMRAPRLSPTKERDIAMNHALSVDNNFLRRFYKEDHRYPSDRHNHGDARHWLQC